MENLGGMKLISFIPFQLGLKYLIYHIAKSSLPPTFFFKGMVLIMGD